jgi:hypothetical protein
MTDDGLPELCIAIRDALPSIDSPEDREEFIPSDLEMLLTYKRLSTAPHELITHVEAMLRSSKLNAAGRRARDIIDGEERRRDSKRHS